jgi:hypothetical protein
VGVALEQLTIALGVFHTTIIVMWLPTRSTSLPGFIQKGYSIKISDPSIRFPASGYAEYSVGGYESSFEALDTTVPETQNITIYNIDQPTVRGKGNTWDSFNPCQHYKRDVTVLNGGCQYDTDYYNYNIPLRNMWDGNYILLNVAPVSLYGRSDYPIGGQVALYTNPTEGCYHSDEGLADLAVQRMLPGIRPVTSAINSIYELKDIPSIGNTMRRVNLSLDALNNLIVNLPTGYRTLRQILKGPADVYLQNKFNILPLLQDITNVGNSVSVVQSKLNKLTSDAKKSLKTHWGCDLTSFRDSDETFTQGTAYSNPSTVTLRHVCKYGKRRFQATMEFSYEVASYSPKELLWRGVADHLGLSLSPQVIWNAIPWSFVVDWVVGVGPWLSQFTMRQLGITTHITKFGWSINIARDCDIYYNPYGRVSHMTEQSYYRTPANVPLVSSIRLSGLNPTEFSLGGALVLTR